MDRLKQRQVTVDRMEQQLQVNYLSPTLLTLLTLRDLVYPLVRDGSSGRGTKKDLRVVNLSTGFHMKGKFQWEDRLQSLENYENMKVSTARSWLKYK